jgi:tetratricopeptide (TPR) repeat protein
MCRIVLMALVITMGGTFARAQEAVTVRAWQHSDFARLVFDWPAPTGYSANIADQVLTVQFDRALQVDLSTVRERLGDYITQANGPGAAGTAANAVSFQLTSPMSVTDFTNENSIVVDLRRSEATPQAQNPPVQSAQQPAADPAAQPFTQPVTQAAQAGAIDLPVRIGDHPGYTRIVFDWPQSVPYTVNQNGRAVTLDFGRAATVDVAALAQTLPPGIRVASVRPSGPGTAITLAVPEGSELRHFPLDQKVVLDVLATAEVRNQPAAALATDQLASDQAPQVAQPPQEPPVQSAPAETAQESASADPAPADPEPVRDPVPAPEAPQAVASEPSAAEMAAMPGAPTQQDEAATPPVEAPSGPPLFNFSFQWSGDVGAAVFRRADNIWVIFDAATNLDLSPLRVEGAPVIERIDQLPIGGASVLRMQVPDHSVNASARREGFNWVVEFRRAPQRPLAQVPILADVTAEIGPFLTFPTDTPGRSFNVPDPDMGDVMRVATFLESGIGIDGLRQYPEFELLPTAQGVALIRLSDTVLLDRNFDGFQISAPDGLAISGVSPEAPVSTGQILSARRLFDLNGLMRGPQQDFDDLSNAVFRSMAEVPDEKVDAARLNYAGFLMAHNRGFEALGVLRVVEENDPQLMKRPENLALQGASTVLVGRPEEAKRLLNDPRLDGFAEAAIWRGAALAEEGDYLAAAEAFGPGDSLLSRYPYPLKARLGLMRIDTAFANRDVQGAEAWINSLQGEREELTRGEQAALDYQRARLAVSRTEFDEGAQLFKDVMASGDRKYAYRAELALITLGQRQGFMSDAEALERMERLRYAWRGDRSELYLLKRLGELYLKQPDYFKGLGVFRTAVKYFPGDPVAEDLAGEMTDIFRRLYLDGQADSLPPLKALALYDEFMELTPSGEDGDQIIENIADRLASIDLLTEASEKLRELLNDEDRLPPGEERVRLSNKLALILLMDGKPVEAEEAIAQGRRGLTLFELSDDLEADRDRLLARAKIQQGDYDDAIKELAGDVSVEADLLRRDLYRTTSNWQESAKVLQRLAGNPPADPATGVEGETARYVINWAVALYKNNDTDGLRDLIDLWAPAMANSSLAGVFDYMTNQTRAPTGGDVLATVDQLIGADRFDAFIQAYRDKLFAPPPTPTAEVTASSS